MEAWRNAKRVYTCQVVTLMNSGRREVRIIHVSIYVTEKTKPKNRKPYKPRGP